MICKYCNTDNPDDAAYCSGCGMELAGICCPMCNTYNPQEAVFCSGCGMELAGIKCPVCNTNNPQEAVFCGNCGSRLNKKHVCPGCGYEMDSKTSFCIKCGRKMDGSEANQSTAQKPASVKPAAIKNQADIIETDSPDSKLTKIFKIVSHSLGIAIASLAIIFTIFMGCEFVNAGMTTREEIFDILVDNGITVGSNNPNVFYYFGTAWTELSDIFNLSDGDWVAYMVTAYIQAGLGALISAVTIITVLVFAIKAIIQCATSITGKRKKGGASAVGAFLAFAGGATALLILNNASKSESYDKLKLGGHFAFNALTVTGLAVCGVLVAIYAAFAILGNGKKQINKAFIVNGSVALGSLVLAIVVTALFASPFIHHTSSSWYTTKLGFNQPFLMLMSASKYDMEMFENSFTGLLIINLAITGFIFVCCALVQSLRIIKSTIKDVTSGKSKAMKGALAKSIKMLIYAIIALVLTIVANKMYIKEAMSEGVLNEISISYAPLIGIVVVSVLALAAEIARKVVKLKFVEA